MARELLASRAENEAIRQEMERDPSVIMLGEDIAGAAGRAHLGFVDAWGGPMGSTKGLIQQFGPERIIDTPICEMSFIGAAVGAAITGLRPIAELMFVNFVGVALDSVMNEGAFLRYMLGGQVQVPMVLKTAIGATATNTPNGGGSAAQHSGSMYSIFARIPGLKCVAPSDAYTAKGLLAAAIRDDNFVVYFSHRKVGPTKMEVPEEAYTLPIGKARTLRAGRDVTLVGISNMTNVCLEAATMLSDAGRGCRGDRPVEPGADRRRVSAGVRAADQAPGGRRRGLAGLRSAPRRRGAGGGSRHRLPGWADQDRHRRAHAGAVQWRARSGVRARRRARGGAALAALRD